MTPGGCDSSGSARFDGEQGVLSPSPSNATFARRPARRTRAACDGAPRQVRATGAEPIGRACHPWATPCRSTQTAWRRSPTRPSRSPAPAPPRSGLVGRRAGPDAGAAPDRRLRVQRAKLDAVRTGRAGAADERRRHAGRTAAHGPEARGRPHHRPRALVRQDPEAGLGRIVRPAGCRARRYAG